MKQGNPESEWAIHGSINGVGDANIQGFATDISVNHGQTVNFKIATDSTNYRIEIYRIGYYGGMGARRVDTINVDLANPQVQPHPIVDYSLGLIDAGNWSVSASWNVPADAVSGVYIAHLVREDGTVGENEIPFIVRNDEARSDITFQTSDTTWQAYNAWGGASLYGGDVPTNPADMIGYMPPNCNCGLQAIGRAYAVSYNRPFITSYSPYSGGPQDYLYGAEYSAIRWLEQNGYDINYISGVDTARAGSQLLNTSVFLSVGHDEYWSGEQRANVEAARDAGVNLAFWSGNEVYWRTRWETSIDGNGTPYRTMVTYKETWANADIDPSSTPTGTWRDPRFGDPNQKPENALTGTIFQVDSYRLDQISIPYDYSNLRFWRNTDISNISQGQTGTLVQNLLGYEWDSDVDNGFRPAGLINLSLSTVAVDHYLYDYGTTVGPATATHSLTMYRAASGALVFGAGTVYWSWGLDDNHANEPTPTDKNVQQAMVNMFADMGVQPQTLQASLIAALGTSDFTRPTSTITSTIGGTFVEGQHVTVTGTAQDFGGGLVAGVEVSLDGGNTWHKASGRESWSYSWVAQAAGTYSLRSRAVDDSLNIEIPSTGGNFTVATATTASLWPFSSKPTTTGEYTADRNEVELGVQFTASQAGTITGIEFYKGFYNAGVHTAHLWTSTGVLLATATFTGESSQGWQQVLFNTPVQISAGQTYIASYHTNGFYSADDSYFATPRTNGPLTAMKGVYAYGANGVFPNGTSTDNYWVDVVFNPITSNLAPVANNDTGYTGSQNTPITFSAATLLANDTDPNADPLTITGVSNPTNGTIAFNAQTNTVTFTPTNGYTGPAGFSYAISDGRGGTASATVSMTINPPGQGLSLFGTSTTPAVVTVNDTNSVELGMRFDTNSAGTITGMRFYKGPQNTGPHTGSLWSSTGTLLATATFGNETASGWQTVNFSNPVTVTAGSSYVVSYHTNGYYSADSNYFATAHSSGPLTAPASTASAGNGVYAYGTASTFPTSTYNATSYWVDVVFNMATGNQVPLARNDGTYTTQVNTPITIQASALTTNDSDPNGDPLTVTGVSSASNGTVSLDAQAQTVTFTPANNYVGAASFSYTVSDGQGGSATASVSMNVKTPDQTIFASSVPTITAVNDVSPVELGVKFQADVAGSISAIRFYRGDQETGNHAVSLWSNSGTLLARATSTNETASGWQTVNLAQPVSIAAGTTYVASYLSNGGYAVTPDFFSSDVVNGHLKALSDTNGGGNGVYAYGTSPAFPTNSYNRSNYYVDVVFNPQLAA